MEDCIKETTRHSSSHHNPVSNEDHPKLVARDSALPCFLVGSRFHSVNAVRSWVEIIRTGRDGGRGRFIYCLRPDRAFFRFTINTASKGVPRFRLPPFGRSVKQNVSPHTYSKLFLDEQGTHLQIICAKTSVHNKQVCTLPLPAINL